MLSMQQSGNKAVTLGLNKNMCEYTCLNNGLKCTNLCKLQTCANQCSEDEPAAQLTDTDVDDDDDDVDL